MSENLIRKTENPNRGQFIWTLCVAVVMVFLAMHQIAGSQLTPPARHRDPAAAVSNKSPLISHLIESE